MKISKRTLDVLKSFSQINQSIYVEAGSDYLSTISIDKNVLGKTNIEETFDTEFGIYNLGEFLSAASLIEDPDFDFKEKGVVISNSKSKITYKYVAKDLVVSPPNEVKFPDVDISFVVKSDDLDQAVKAAAVLSAPFIVIYNEDGAIMLGVTDPGVDGSNTWKKQIGAYDGDNEFNFIIAVANIMLLPNDYKVDISSKGITHWVAEGAGSVVEYYLALDLNSTFS